MRAAVLDRLTVSDVPALPLAELRCAASWPAHFRAPYAVACRLPGVAPRTAPRLGRENRLRPEGRAQRQDDRGQQNPKLDRRGDPLSRSLRGPSTPARRAGTTAAPGSGGFPRRPCSSSDFVDLRIHGNSGVGGGAAVAASAAQPARRRARRPRRRGEPRTIAMPIHMMTVGTGESPRSTWWFRWSASLTASSPQCTSLS